MSMPWTGFLGWLPENVLTLVCFSAGFGFLSVLSGILAGYAGHLEAVTAKVEAAKANQAAAQGNERAAVANQKAAEATLSLEKLKTPRQLSPAQIASISSSLRRFSGAEFVFSIQTDPESIELMKQLSETLTDAA